MCMYVHVCVCVYRACVSCVRISDVRYAIFLLLPIMIIAHVRILYSITV